MKVDVYVEGERLDLFDYESISVTQGVQDVKDISKLFADFSQSFSVPASNNNNRIFKHYYNADIDGGFDARTRKLATIDVNTLDFKRGKIQLEGVTIKDGEPESYRLTFYGDAIKIKDLIGDDKLFQLEWLDNFDHDYNESIVLDGLTTGLDFNVDGNTYSQAVIYPLISYTRQYKYDSDPSDTTSSATLVNIAYDAGRSDGVKFSDLKPAIKLELIIEAIQRQYGLNFVGSFFESQDFKKIYMSLNNSTETLSNGIINFETESGASEPESSDSGDRLVYQVTITPLATFEDVKYKIKLEWNGQNIYENNNEFTGTKTVKGFVETPTSEYEVKATIITEEDFDFDANTRLEFEIAGSVVFTYFTNSYTNQSIDLRTVINSLMYDIEVYNFLTSIFKMFNLVVVAQGTDLLVEDLPTWYTQGNIIDISQYVDSSKLSVNKGKVYNQINFLFEESEQILADEYRRNVRRGYGDIKQSIYTDETKTTLLDGDKLDIEVVFENPVFERLTDQDNLSLTTIQYCPYFDRELQSISGNPFLFYADNTSVAIGYAGVSSYQEVNGGIWMPSHQRQIGGYGSFALNFEAELSEYHFNVMSNNIYSRNYQDYISDVFSVKRRNYTLEGILPDYILQGLKLNDRVVINDRRYIINKLTSNIVKRKDSFELINDIYDAPLISDTITSGVFSPTNSVYTAQAVDDSVRYIGDAIASPSLEDLGDGTGWVTIESNSEQGTRTINFSLDANATGNTRAVEMRLVNLNRSFAKFTIIQDA